MEQRADRARQPVGGLQLSLADARPRDFGLRAGHVGATQTFVPAVLAAHRQDRVDPGAVEGLTGFDRPLELLLRHRHLVLLIARLKHERLPLQLVLTGNLAPNGGLVPGDGDVHHRRRWSQ